MSDILPQVEQCSGRRLLLIIISLIIHHIEESKLINPLTRAHNPQPIPQLLLLQELLSQVLQISSRERNMADDLNLPLSTLADRNLITQVPSSSLNLDLIMQKLLECGEVEDFIGYWLAAVDCILASVSEC